MSGSPWPPRQLPPIGPRWKANGSRCTVKGCASPRQAWAMVAYPVGQDFEPSGLIHGNGPQGAWRCGNGHVGYLWPHQCDYPQQGERE